MPSRTVRSRSNARAPRTRVSQIGDPALCENNRMNEQKPYTPFLPVPKDFPGHPMPASVPNGLQLQLSRSRIVE